MIASIISDFFSYCKTYNFGKRSLEVFSSKLKEFSIHLYSLHIHSIKDITYNHIISFVTSGTPSLYTNSQLKAILNYFISFATSETVMRNLIIILFFVFLGLRITSIINIDIPDVDLRSSSLLVTEKGNRKRIVPLPQVLCTFLFPYIKVQGRDLGPLFLSARNKRLSLRSVQHLFAEASDVLGMRIYSRIFRHTAATDR